MRQALPADPLLVWKWVFLLFMIFYAGQLATSPSPLLPEFGIADLSQTSTSPDVTIQASVESGLAIFTRQLEKMKTADPVQEQLVLLVGNSLLRHALRSPSQVNAELHPVTSLPDGISLRVEAAWGPWLYLEHMSPWFSEMLAKRPSLIVIQSDLFFSDPNGGARYPLVEGLRNWERETPLLPLEQRTPRDHLQAKWLWSGKVINKGSNWQAGTLLVRQCLAEGIDVVLVDLPPSRSVASFATPTYFRERRLQLASLVIPGRVRLFSTGTVLSDDHFTDYNHMNLAGSHFIYERLIPYLSSDLGDIR